MALGVSTVGAVVIGWVVFLGVLLAWLWLRGGRSEHPDAWSNLEFSERRVPGHERRRQNVGPPPGEDERRTGFERRQRGLTVADG